MLQMQLEITTKVPCPINCRYCPQDALKKAYKGVDTLSLDDFKLAVDKTPYYVVINFAGFSEPFLNPQAIEMMEYAVQTKHHIHLYTTLVGLKIEDVERLAKIPIDFLCLHLPDNLGNCKISAPNYKDVLYAVLTRLRVDDFSVMNENFVYGTSQKCYAKDNGRVGLLPSGLKTNFAGTFNCKKLILPQFVMLPNLDVVLCCMDFALKHKIGNLKTQSWDDLLTSPEYTRVRKERFDINGTSICRRCKEAVLTC